MTGIPLLTIGYQSARFPELRDALLEAGTKLLIDVRAIAASRHPGFSKRLLAGGLAEAGIDYIHLQPSAPQRTAETPPAAATPPPCSGFSAPTCKVTAPRQHSKKPARWRSNDPPACSALSAITRPAIAPWSPK